MATDSDAIVRRAMAEALAHLLPLLPDLHKFQAVSACLIDILVGVRNPRLLLKCIGDSSQDTLEGCSGITLHFNGAV